MSSKSTTFVATSLMTSIVAATLTIPGGAAQAAQAAQAGGVQLADYVPHRFMAGGDCIFSGVRLTHRSIRHYALVAGYRDIHNIRFVARRHGPERWCGFYRADAMMMGRPFVIYADSRSGRIVGRQEVARYGHGRYQNLSAVQVRTILLNYGYQGIRDIRYVRRDGRDFHLARAVWRGWVVRLQVDDDTGRVVNRERLRRRGGTFEVPDLSQQQLRELLRRRGYRDIREVRSEPTAYDVVAYLGSVPYRIRVSVSTGEIESEYRLR